MNYRLLLVTLLCPDVAGLAAPGVETVFQPVALAGAAAPGLTNNSTFSPLSGFSRVSLADDGRIAFTAAAVFRRPGALFDELTTGLWAGFPGDLQLLARTGDPAPGDTHGAALSALSRPNLDNHQAVVFFGQKEGQTGDATDAYRTSLENPQPPPVLMRQAEAQFLPSWSLQSAPFVSDVNTVAGRVALIGPGSDETNRYAIVAGPATNLMLVARTGFPAPGTAGNFTFLDPDSRKLAITPDGNVAFIAESDAGTGVWFGQAGTLQAVMLSNAPAPVSLLGPGFSFGVHRGANISVNARGELACVTSLSGPGLNATNSDFVVVGPPGALRVAARSGQPAPGVPGAFFQSFSEVLLGSDSAVAFRARHGPTSDDLGLWLAPANGSTPMLLMRYGAPAPGTPAGTVFTPGFVEAIFMNARNQISFSAWTVLGAGAIARYGIWLAEPDGTVNLIVQEGDVFDLGNGLRPRIAGVIYGEFLETLAGPEDGRSSSFNDRGEMALKLLFEPPPPFSSAGFAIYIAQTGIHLRTDGAGNDIRIKFPTLAGKHYRVDTKTELTETAWSVFSASVDGTGGQVTVTNSGVTALSATRFYRVARKD